MCNGHQVSISVVKTRKAVAGSQRTLMCRRIGEGAEDVVPHGLQVGAKGGEPVRVDAVEIAAAVALVQHEPGVPQDREVLRHRRATHGQLRGEFADGTGTLAQQLEHAAPGRVPERLPGLIRKK
jgi:hypothetical protein